ncbi:hypothetical protein ABIE50_006314 [Chitinophaga sp. OAE865]
MLFKKSENLIMHPFINYITKSRYQTSNEIWYLDAVNIYYYTLLFLGGRQPL